MSVAQSLAERNALLARLPHEDRERFAAGCESVALESAEVLAEPGKRMRYVYFPIESVITLMTQKSAQRNAQGNEQPSMEVGLVGNEGMLGATTLLGGDDAPLHASVQDGGAALRMNMAAFRRELGDSPALQQVVQRYLFSVMCQLAQASACARFHVVEARLARLLLMTRDRVHADAFRSTHAFLANMLGVRRVGVTKAATALQQRKLIAYHRGNITILDGEGLLRTACACYEIDRAIYARAFNASHERSRDPDLVIAGHDSVPDPHAVTNTQIRV